MRRRFVSWTAAIRDMRADRIHFAPGDRQTALRQRAFADLAFRRAQSLARIDPLLDSGAYNRRAIMRLAVAAAKARRATTGEGWRVCVSAALEGTWRAAKAARLTAAWNASRSVANVNETSFRTGTEPKLPAVRPNATFEDADASSTQLPRVALNDRFYRQPIPPERIPGALCEARPSA